MKQQGEGKSWRIFGGIVSLLLHFILFSITFAPPKEAVILNQTVRINIASRSQKEALSSQKDPAQVHRMRKGAPKLTPAEALPSLSPQAEEIATEPPSSKETILASTGDEVARASSMATDDAAYALLVRSLLLERRIYPLAAQRLGLEGTVELAFTIGLDGLVAAYDIDAAAVAPSLIEAAQRTLAAAQPFPPPLRPTAVRVKLVYKINHSKIQARR